MPKTMSFALNRLVGTNNESVSTLRLALVKVTMRIIKVETDFFRAIRLAE